MRQAERDQLIPDVRSAGRGWHLLTWLIGAEKENVHRVLLSFVSLFFLLLSYYLIKPLRNSQFLKEFDPSYLPVVALVVPFLSIAVTALFNALIDRYDRYRVVSLTFLTITAVKLVFAWALLSLGKPAVITFYFFASTYFMLAIAILWACINDIFTAKQSKRCFAFITLGATLGNIAGTALSADLAESAWKDYAIIFSAMAMAIALMTILKAAGAKDASRRENLEPEKTEELELPGQQSHGLLADVRELLARPYVRRIGIMVFCLAFFNTGIEFLSQRAIDRELSRQQFSETFTDSDDKAFELVYHLKSMDGREREDSLIVLAGLLRESDSTTENLYAQYRSELEAKTRFLFSRVFFYQGVISIFLLLVVVRLLFQNLGVRTALLVLPAVSALTLFAFSFPIDLMTIQIVLVVFGAANYSLNNAAKEVLYSATNRDTKFKFKPLIEGPGMRTGDIVASVLMLLTGGLAVLIGLGTEAGEIAFRVITLIVITIWAKAVTQAGREFDKERVASD